MGVNFQTHKIWQMAIDLHDESVDVYTIKLVQLRGLAMLFVSSTFIFPSRSFSFSHLPTLPSEAVWLTILVRVR
jgi:hypothetical protein